MGVTSPRILAWWRWSAIPAGQPKEAGPPDGTDALPDGNEGRHSEPGNKAGMGAGWDEQSAWPSPSHMTLVLETSRLSKIRGPVPL